MLFIFNQLKNYIQMKKIFFLKLSALTIIVLMGFSNTLFGQYTGTGTFTKISGAAALTDGYYLICDNYMPGADPMALDNTLNGVWLDVADEYIDPDPSMVWKIESNGTYKTIYNEALSIYLSYNGPGTFSGQPTNATSAEDWSVTIVGNWYSIQPRLASGYGLKYDATSSSFDVTMGAMPLSFYKMSTSVPTPTLTVSPSSLNFEDIPVSTTDTQPITVSGSNLTADINYTLTGIGADAFTIDATGWNAATGGTLGVTFGSDVVGYYSAMITFSTAGADNKTVMLYGNTVAGGVTDAETPVITTQPVGDTYNQDATATDLTVVATISDEGTLSYQWYSNMDNSTVGGTPVGTNNNSYTPSTATLGTMYYYVTVTNTNNSVNGNTTASVTSSIATVTVIQEEEYTITASAGTGGSISPDGEETVTPGATPTFIITPNAGYHITAILIDGIPITYTVNSEVTAPYTYTFEPVYENHTITATFAQNCYTKNLGDVQDAVVKMYNSNNLNNEIECALHGSNVTFKFIADCYNMQVWIGGVNQGAIEQYVMPTPVTGALPLIEVYTTMKTYTITATPLENTDPMGEISSAGVTTVNCGSNMEYIFLPHDGYRVKLLLVDGESKPIPSNKRYTFTNIHTDHSIHIEFEEYPQYIIEFGPNAAQNAGGTVFPTDFPDAEYYWAVDSGTVSFPFTIQPDPGFVIDKVFVDDSYMASAVLTGTYNFIDINANHTIYATFIPVMFTIVAEAGAGGTINPSGNVQVEQGADQSFLIVPNFGYSIDEVKVDGEVDPDATATGFHLFEEVVANHTISATFIINTYEITATTDGNGTISPSGLVMVTHGSNKTFTFYPNLGYRVDKVYIDGEEDYASPQTETYTFENIDGPHTIHVTFTLKSFLITSGSSAGGTIEPEGESYVLYNEHSEIYVFNPLQGYHVEQVLVDGVNNTQAVLLGEYRFLNVDTNHDIYVIFDLDKFTIVATATIGGVISPAGAVSVPYGSDKSFTFGAEVGFELVHVLIDNIENLEALAAGEYTFTEIDGDHTIFAQFEKLTYTVTLPQGEGFVANAVAGYVSPVDYGAMFKFVVDLLEGYTQSNIIVRANNMVINPVAGIYTLNNIMIDQVVTVSGITDNQYQITSKAGNVGGTISPTGTFVLNHGEDMSFIITPDTDYKIDYLLVNGVTETPAESYTFFNIKSDATIVAYFKYNVGIGENEEALISVFSHNKVVTIVNEALIPVQQVEIMDMYGRFVWQGQTTGERTEITLNVATGIYNVRIITTDNQMFTTKVVITH